MTTHEVLVAARNLIDRQGYNWWNYGDREDKADCPICPEGALDRVRGIEHGLDQRDPVKDLVARFVPQVPGYKYDWLSLAVCRARNERGHEFSTAEVLAFFDAAIAETAPPPEDFPTPEFEPTKELVA